MKTISIRELHARTGHWVRHAAANGGVTVTDNGMPVATIEAKTVDEKPKVNKFANRKLLPGYKKLMGKLVGGTDSTQIISEDRHRPL